MEILEWFTKEEINQLLLDILSIGSHRAYEHKELEVARWIKHFFENENIEVTTEDVEPKRPNVIATLGDGDPKKAKLMFNGHMDTVPGFDMNHPPFEPFITEGKVYGRGAADMKSALVAMMIALATAKRSNLDLKESIVFTGVIDEEESSKGAEDLVKRGYQPEHVIIGEPTQLAVNSTHKGMEWIEFTFYGKSAHGSTPQQGKNAVYAASEFCQILETELQPKLKQRKNDTLGSGAISVGRISGGERPNTIPSSCTVEIDRRWLPEESIDEVNNEMINLAKEIAAKRNMSFDSRIMKELTASMGNHPYRLSADDPFFKQVAHITENITGKQSQEKAFPAWSDAGILGVQTDAKCLILGPGHINQAHAADDYCSLKEIYHASEIYFNLIQAMEESNHEQ